MNYSFLNNKRICSPLQNIEFDLLILCSRSIINHETRTRVQQIIDSQSVNWDTVYDLSVKFGILPLFYRNLKSELFNNIPRAMEKKIHTAYLINVARNLRLSNELLKIINILEEKNIIVLPLKGPILSEAVYGVDYLRMSSDIDIFVKGTDVVRAREILIKAGYQELNPIDKKYDPFYLKIEHAFCLLSPNSNINIDLQWKLLGNYSPSPITIKKIQSELITQQYRGKEIYQLSIETLLFYLCVHGTKDGWYKLEWICCITELIRTHNTLNWNKVYDTAKKLRCYKKLLLGLYLAKSLCDISLPAKVENDLSNNKVLKTIGQLFIDFFLFNTPIRPKLTVNQRFSKYHIQIQDNIFQKAAFIIRQFFRPVKKDILLMPLHKRLVFLYYITRPLRLLGETFKSCLKNTTN